MYVAVEIAMVVAAGPGAADDRAVPSDVAGTA